MRILKDRLKTQQSEHTET